MFRRFVIQLGGKHAQFELLENGRIVRLKLTRPEARNALSLPMCEVIEECTTDISRPTSNARVLIITGDSTSFSAGKDLKASLNHSDEEASAYFNATFGAVKSLLNVPVPIVVGIEKICLGLGLELALTGDIRVSGESAQIGFPEINLSLFPGCGGAVMLPLVLGNVSIASEMILSGRRLGAIEAKSVGLVSRVVPDGTSEDECMSIAKSIAEKNRNLLVKTKEIVKFDFHKRMFESGWIDRAEKYRMELGKSQEHIDALHAFAQKR
jgi:enoyl-CoA hydratase/carnithine racemase